MRLESLWVDGFKNLNDFKIDFGNRDGITVLIGNNASGKSNILEAISAIFAGLYNNTLDELDFKFDLIYNIDNLDVRVSKKQKVRFKVKKPTIKTWKKIEKLYSHGNRFPLRFPITFGEPYSYLPSQVIALYSGEETRLWEDHYQYFYNKFQKSINPNNLIPSEQKMFYVDGDYWNIALLTIAYSKLENLQNFITNDLKINIENITFNFNTKLLNDEFKLNTSSLLVMQLFVEIIKVKGKFDTSLMPDNEWVKRAESLGELTTDDDIAMANGIIKALKSEEIHLKELQGKYFSLPRVALIEINAGFEKEFFKNILIATNAKTKKHQYIHNIDIYFNDGQTVVDLSEGQKKQILLKLALEVLADENSLLLFDEPDAHIHISNKKLIPEMLKDYGNREIILTTHSPTLAHSFDNKHLAYVENGKINTEYNSKEKLLNELTHGLMGVSEQQILLQSNKDILIVEGKTDEAYISAALKALKNDNAKYKDLDFNFLWLGGTDADSLNKVIEEFKPKENQTIIAFFDRGDSGSKCIKKVFGKDIEKKDFEGKEQDGVHIYFYPKKDGFTESNFEVEDYFPIDILQKFTFKQIKTFANLKSGFKKVDFSKECEKENFDKSNFDGFKTLFDLILEIKPHE